MKAIANSLHSICQENCVMLFIKSLGFRLDSKLKRSRNTISMPLITQLLTEVSNILNLNSCHWEFFNLKAVIYIKYKVRNFLIKCVIQPIGPLCSKVYSCPWIWKHFSVSCYFLLCLHNQYFHDFFVLRFSPASLEV